ncbi:MAG: glycosyltransferase [Candidatus Omnitrophota bacterium]
MNDTVIFYATAGIGHKKAALAVKEAFDKSGHKDVLIADVLDYTSRFFRVSYGAIYLFLIKYLPTLWGFSYYILDNPVVYFFLSPIRRLVNGVNSRKLVEFLLEAKPKTVIVTHFMPSEVIANLKKKGLLSTRLISVITDYRSHSFWLSKYVDCYVAGSDYTRDDLIRRGIPPDKIRVFGIPCASSFSKEHDTEKIRGKVGLQSGKATVFVLGGGFGVGPIRRITLHLDRAKQDFQVIVVCGYNARLYKAIKRIARFAKHRFRVYGFIDNVDELMAISDVLVSKPGGITVTEALNAGVPMIVVDPIPGQEMRNYGFLEKNRAASKIKRPEDIIRVVGELIGSDGLKVLRENVRKIRLTHSAERIMNEAVK